MTIIGSPDSAASDAGLLIREGTAAALSNVVVFGMNESCLDIDHTSTFNQITSGDLTITNTRLDCVTNFEQNDQDFDGDTINDDDPTDIAAWFSAEGTNSLGATDLEDPTNPTAPNFAPKSTSALLGAGAAPADAFFDSVDFIGAIGSDDWTVGWTTAAPN